MARSCSATTTEQAAHLIASDRADYLILGLIIIVRHEQLKDLQGADYESLLLDYLCSYTRSNLLWLCISQHPPT
jgi:hypothetical protein